MKKNILVLQGPQRMWSFACLQNCLLTLTCHLPGGSPTILAQTVKRCQYLLKYGCGGRFVFVVIFSPAFSSLTIIFGRVFFIVVLVHFFRVRNCHHSNLPDHIPSSIRSSCSFLHLILVDPLSGPKTSSRISVFLFLSSSSHRRTHSLRSRNGRGESECD